MFSVQTTGNEESELDQQPDEVRGGGEDTQNQQHKKTEYDQLYPDYSDPEVSLKKNSTCRVLSSGTTKIVTQFLSFLFLERLPVSP